MGAAALRLAALSGAAGLERAVAAAILAMALIVAETLVLGRVGLSSSSTALGLAAAATWLAARIWTPAPAVGAGAELAYAWRGASAVARAGAGALAVATIGWVGWQLRHPFIGLDGYLYHLPLAGSWAHGGHAGSTVDIVEGLPVSNYPVTGEVGVSWALALSHSWVWASVITPLYGVVLGAGGWLGLRRAGVGRGISALAIAAFVSQPVVATQFGGPLTDVAAVAWLVATAGLCVAARSNARLLPVALIGAALSFGTKTTGSVVLLVALAWATWPHRRALAPLVRPLGLAAALGVVVGGAWTLRNLVDHGSPLWPFQSTSFGDPVPATLQPFKASFLSHPHAMLSGRTNDYLTTLAGGAILLFSPVLAVIISRARAVVVLSVVSVLAVLVWGAAPYTGIAQSTALATGATRYLLPALVCCTAAAALAAGRTSPRGRAFLGAVLVVSVIRSVIRTWQLGFPYVPSLAVVLALAAAGAVLALIAGTPIAARLGRLVPSVLVAPALVLAVAAGLSHNATGYVARHADAGLGDSSVLGAISRVPAYENSHVEVAMAPTTIALLRGDHLEHNLVFLANKTPCADVRRRAIEQVVVLQRIPSTPAYRRLSGCLHGLKPVFEDPAMQLYARA
jgi:hypothetical protein